MKQTCKYLGYIMLILGIIGSFLLANVSGAGFDERNWGVTISVFLSGALASSAFAFILLGIAEILERLESVSKKQTASVSDTYSHGSALTRAAEEQDKTFWKCPQCGKSNPPYTGTCGCGCSKP